VHQVGKKKTIIIVHLVGFIIRIYHDARSTERQIFTQINQLYVKLYINGLFYVFQNPFHVTFCNSACGNCS